MCDRQEQLVGYLYDELGVEERRDFEAHLDVCAACAGELEGLRSTRTYLAHWAPPEPDLGFRVIRGASAPAPALPRRPRLASVMRLAAAAVIVLAVAAAIANVEVRYGSEGVTIRTGWGPRGAADPGETASAPTAAAEAARTHADFEALERRLRDLEAALVSQSSDVDVQTASTTRMADAEMLRRVRQIVSEAESRQQVAVAQQLLQLWRDFDRQRRTDLAMIQQGLAQSQGLTNAEIATQRDMLHQLVRAASTRQEK